MSISLHTIRTLFLRIGSLSKSVKSMNALQNSPGPSISQDKQTSIVSDFLRVLERKYKSWKNPREGPCGKATLGNVVYLIVIVGGPAIVASYTYKPLVLKLLQLKAWDSMISTVIAVRANFGREEAILSHKSPWQSALSIRYVPGSINIYVYNIYRSCVLYIASSKVHFTMLWYSTKLSTMDRSAHELGIATSHNSLDNQAPKKCPEIPNVPPRVSQEAGHQKLGASSFSQQRTSITHRTLIPISTTTMRSCFKITTLSKATQRRTLSKLLQHTSYPHKAALFTFPRPCSVASDSGSELSTQHRSLGIDPRPFPRAGQHLLSKLPRKSFPSNLSSLSDSSISGTLESLPPDSDIALLWDEVRDSLAKTTHSIESYSVTMATSAVTTTNQRNASHGLEDYSIKILEVLDLADDAAIRNYLDMSSVNGQPQFAHVWTQDFEKGMKSWKHNTSKVLLESVVKILLFPHPEAIVRLNWSLPRTGETPPTQGSTADQEQGSRFSKKEALPTDQHSPPDLDHLVMGASTDLSNNLHTRSFGLDIQSTFRSFVPLGYLNNISRLLVDQTTSLGAVFLQVVCADGDSKCDLVRNWAIHAQSEILKQLHFSRAFMSTEKKKDIVSRLSFFGYLFQNNEVQIWRMKVQIPSGDEKVSPNKGLALEEEAALNTKAAPRIGATNLSLKSTAKNMDHKQASGLGDSAKRFPKPAPSNSSSSRIPTHSSNSASQSQSKGHTQARSYAACEIQQICKLDLKSSDGIKAFCTYNTTIMKWGQARYCLPFAQNLQLQAWKEDDPGKWTMTEEEMIEYYKGVVTFRKLVEKGDEGVRTE